MRPLLELARARLSGRNVVAVMSGKGGVGKSVVAALLALSKPKSALIDLDLFGMSAPRLFGAAGLHKVEKEGIRPFEVGGVKLFSLHGIVGDKFVVLPGASQGGVAEALLAFADLDGVENVVVDMPPGMGEELLTLSRVAQFKPVVVSTPSATALKVAGHLLEYLAEMSTRPPVVVLNMSYVQCGGSRVYPFGDPKKAADAFSSKTERVVELPIDPELEGYVGRIAQYKGPVYAAIKDLVAPYV
ncbi:MAG: P-loop NTPase [Thermoproteus sp.]